MISQKLNSQIADALKAKDEVRLNALRMLLSSLSYEKIAKMHDLSDEEELEVIAREAKKRRESAKIYQDAGRSELAQKELTELKVLEEFLPEQLTDEELEKIVDNAIAEVGADIKNMGAIMGSVMSQVKGRADGGKISQMIKQKLA